MHSESGRASLTGLSSSVASRGYGNLALPDGFFEAVLGFVAIAAAAFSHGGYYPTAWGWFAVVALWLIAVRVVLRRVSLGALEVAAILAFGAVACWIAVSGVWGIPERTILEVERVTLYVAAFAAACVVLTRGALPALVSGLWAAVSVACGYGLLTRLFPERLSAVDPLGGNRLSEPLGYWNGLGVFAAIGTLLAVGLVARASTRGGRMITAASLPLLCSTLYFTFSRGAWIALAVGFFAAIALDPRRLQLVTSALALAPAVAVTLVVAYRSPALNQIGGSSVDAARAGHRLAVVMAVAMALSALGVLLVHWLERRSAHHRRLRRAYATALVAGSLAALLVLFVEFGSPPTLVSRTYHAFAAPPPELHGRLNERLFNLSGSGRLVQWRVAWRAYQLEPILGSGAGTYEQAWNELRPTPYKVRDAHSLYLETLAELGPVGLGLLLIALGIPILGAIRARRLPLVSATFGAYIAFVVHAGVDWDWELPAVTLLALLCAATLLVSARGERNRVLSGHVRMAVAAAALCGAVFSAVGLVGNRSLARGEAALNAGQVTLATDRARAALRWAPWSAQARRLLAEAQLAAGELERARSNLRRAAAADPRDWSLWFALAQTTSGPESARALAEARRLNPRSPEIRSYVSSTDGLR